MRITVPVGTRAEAIKLAGVVGGLRGAAHDVRVVATGPHVDPKLDGDAFAELDLRIDTRWDLPSDEGARVGALLAHSFAEFEERRPDAVLVLGDTYTAPLVAIAARRHGVGVVHLEAGLRSFNGRSMEEVNRRQMVALATVHLAPTELAAAFLRDEGVAPERIRVVGNPIVDTLQNSGVNRVPLARRSGVTFTAHRASNVDDPERLAALVAILTTLGSSVGTVTFPVHPRTRTRLQENGMWDALAASPDVLLREPLAYGAMLRLLAGSRLVVTDSGGLQEEASYFGVPAVVMRQSTSRWEGIVNGGAVLTGVDLDRVLSAARQLTSSASASRIATLPCPYGDGRTVGRVVTAFSDEALLDLLQPMEPDYRHSAPPLPAGVAL
ncbi:MAG: UDP-N-acetylglucosamine 2-epimerase [Frankiales bacterium]|nr:UDP-N-acetylglucosamine 2-epimerase [Frankiales bacterium]